MVLVLSLAKGCPVGPKNGEWRKSVLVGAADEGVARFQQRVQSSASPASSACGCTGVYEGMTASVRFWKGCPVLHWAATMFRRNAVTRGCCTVSFRQSAIELAFPLGSLWLSPFVLVGVRSQPVTIFSS